MSHHLDRAHPSPAYFAIFAIALTGCISSYLPSLRTEGVDVAGVQSGGLTLRIHLSATNDRYHDTIVVDNLQVHVVVANQDLGTVERPEAWQLPPNQPVFLDADVTVPLNNVPDLALRAVSGPVPYELDGRAYVQNVGWSVDFHYSGFIPQEQFLGAAVNQLPIPIPILVP